MGDKMHIKRIDTTNKPFVPFHLVLDFSSPADKCDLHDILHDYITRYPNVTTDRTALAKKILKLLNE